MPNVVLALHIINEYCKQDSFWKSYLSILPSEYNIPLYFNEEQMAQLKPSQVFEESVKMVRNISRQYSYFSHQMQVNPVASKLSFKNQFTYVLYR